MYNLSDIGVIKKLLFEAGFSFKKSLGQNFLVNPTVCPDMADASGCAGIGVIEIGTGVGVLTAELCRRAKKVVCIEIDARLKPVLEKTLADFDNYEVIFDDVLKLDLAALIKEKFGDMPVVICANLPYYITSPIIMQLLRNRLPVDSITVMVQKEAADRLTARVGTRAAGAITAAVEFYAQSELVRKVMRGSFMPQPNVDSAVIKLTVNHNPTYSVESEDCFFKLVRAGFEQRRKTLVNSVSSALHIEKSAIIKALQNCNIPENVRAEGLTMEELCRLSNSMQALGVLK